MVSYLNVRYFKSKYYNEVNIAYFELIERMKQNPEFFNYKEDNVLKNFGFNNSSNPEDDDSY